MLVLRNMTVMLISSVTDRYICIVLEFALAERVLKI